MTLHATIIKSEYNVSIMKISQSDFPSEFLKADISSRKAQKNYKGLNLGILIALLGATIMVSINDQLVKTCQNWNQINGIILLLGAAGSTYLYFRKPEVKWYLGRAVAESIKSLSWKFMMKAEPFNSGNDPDDKALLFNRIHEIVEKSGENGFDIDAPSSHDHTITQKMIEVRNSTFLERKDIYATHRVDDQIGWYKTTAIKNKIWGTCLVWLMILCQCIAAMYLIFWAKDFHTLNLTEVIIFIVTALIAIIEMNKYKELKESYSYTHNELIYIRNRFNTINSEKELDEFVNDAELAISREHTMWLARRGK